MQCKLLWIKASTKCINVNVNVNMIPELILNICTVWEKENAIGFLLYNEKVMFCVKARIVWMYTTIIYK